YDWSADAGTLLTGGPGAALRNAPNHGFSVALQLEDPARHYDYVHFIAHSAGAALIQSAVNAIRSVDTTTVIHSSFLDPYNPNFEDYGTGSDYADVYYTDNDFPSTPSDFLPHASDVDVTATNPNALPPGAVCFAPTQSCNDSHAWPHEWYAMTVGDPA